MSVRKGFTIVELLLATTFFSVILTLVTAGFVQINRTYTKGTIVRDVQSSGRALFEDVTRTLRDSRVADVNFGTTGRRLCVNGVRFAWNQYDTATSTRTNETFDGGGAPFEFARSESSAGCDTPMPITSTSPLGKGVIVQYFAVQPVKPGQHKLLEITLVVSAGNNDIKAGTWGKDAVCDTGRSEQYCGVARFSTIISMRN